MTSLPSPALDPARTAPAGSREPAGRTDAGTAGTAGRGAGTGTTFRRDVEGLRAVAILAVVLFHAGVGAVAGGFVGVDVFFVLSGFLITGLLVREAERAGRVRLGRFWARRARRLLPASALVLVTTAALSWAVLSLVHWRQVGGDIASAALYVVNWRLAAQSVDYLAEGQAVSPVQHFWSLAVEEQFYVLWPLVLVVVLAAVRAARRHNRRLRLRAALAAGLAAVVVPSFAWCVHATAAEPARAYFVTPARLWELGLGGLVAVGAPWWSRLPRRAAAGVGLAGLTAVVGGAVLLDASVTWPGTWSLVPTLGTAAVVVAGTGGRTAAGRVLGTRPLVRLGALSYSWYLWHWPLLVLARVVWPGLGVAGSLLVAMTSLGPAWASYRLVEDPVRRSARLVTSTRRSLALGAVLTVTGVVAGLSLAAATPSGGPPPDPLTVGASTLRVTSDGRVVDGLVTQDSARTLSPMPQDASGDVPAAYARGCQVGVEDTAVRFCDLGDPEGSLDVVLAGDSKALQWSDALDRAGQQEHWRVRTATKSACALSTAQQHLAGEADGAPYTACSDWSRALLAELVAHPPDVVVVSQVAARADSRGTFDEQGLVDGLADAWRRLEAHGTQVVALLDNPEPQMPHGEEVFECVARHLDDLGRCASERSAAVHAGGADAMRRAATAAPGTRVLDLTDLFCDATECPAVIGDVLVYRQGSHVSDTYALSAAPVLRVRLAALVGAD